MPFVWLCFPFRRRVRVYDHVVFVTYSLSFMSLLVVVGSLAAFAGLNAVAIPALFIPPIHIYRQLRGAYGVGRWGAALRTLVLTIAAILTLGLFVFGMVALGMLD